jgi:hypothetical protein
MSERIEKLARQIYGLWKKDVAREMASAHPDEETLACFLEARLSRQEAEQLKGHLLSCSRCAEIFSLQAALKEASSLAVPQDLLEAAKSLAGQSQQGAILEVVLRLKEKVIEVINSSGDILLGQELVPAPVLRSRAITELKDEISIFKDFKDIIVEAKIENRLGRAFNLAVSVKEKTSQRLLRDLRISLFREGRELESYLSEKGRVVFEDVLVGTYVVEIVSPAKKFAVIKLDIRKL